MFMGILSIITSRDFAQISFQEIGAIGRTSKKGMCTRNDME
jgi:hypothetical protein